MYIRASIHNVRFSNDQNDTAAVAVGDTFLFSPLSNSPDFESEAISLDAISPMLQDFCCLTKLIPYYQALVGCGIEEDYTRLVQYCSKHAAT